MPLLEDGAVPDCSAISFQGQAGESAPSDRVATERSPIVTHIRADPYDQIRRYTVRGRGIEYDFSRGIAEHVLTEGRTTETGMTSILNSPV